MQLIQAEDKKQWVKPVKYWWIDRADISYNEEDAIRNSKLWQIAHLRDEDN